MKILQVNKFLYPKGGADKYCLMLINELGKKHEVSAFGMSDEKNIISVNQEYFSENLNYHQKGNSFKKAARLIWNREAAQKFAKLLDKVKPDIIHAHNIYHQLSPSILKEARKRNIPVVMTLHDYKLICPNYLLFCKGRHCQKCLKGNYFHCLFNNCYGSFFRSALATTESIIHNKILKSYQKGVKLFVAPSQYLKNLMLKAGFKEDQIIVLNNPAPETENSPNGNRLLYLGRLSKEKGVDLLLKSLKDTNESLDVVGDGPMEEELKKLTKKLNLEDRVTFYGHLDGEALLKIKREAKAVIVPSLWAENMSLVILESLALSKIVIASAMGGNPELIEHEKTGFLFLPNNEFDLAEKINKLNFLTNIEKENIKANIQEKIKLLSLSKHLDSLEDIYQQIIKQ